jgi:RNA polymerase sigma-70 factor (ECF subfamily)
MATDEDLMRAVASGDERAFEELCHRYERPLFQFLARHVGDQHAADLHQETWLRVARSVARFDASRRFSTWLFQIAVNLARDWHRRPPPEPVDPERIEHPTAGGAAAVEAGLDARRLLAALPEAQRAVVILRLYHDLGEDEVAAILGCARGTVKSRLHSALARLSELTRGA